MLSYDCGGDPLAEDTIYGNYIDKYRPRNPIERYLVGRFLKEWGSLVVSIQKEHAVQRILEVGCGDGYLLDKTRHNAAYVNPDESVTVGLEPGFDVVGSASQSYPDYQFVNGSVYTLPFPDSSFDLVTVPEVFEHLENPAAGLAEVIRVSARYVLASVPWEPVWRIMNLARGAYWSDWGNTPGHLQHFTRLGFIRFISGQAQIRAIRRPFPWTMIFAEKKISDK